MLPQIVAFGGGGFSTEAGNPLLDDYVLALAQRPCPRVCFIPTASGDADHYVVRFYRAFAPPRCEPSHLSLFRRDRGWAGCSFADHLLAQDVIYVGGGSMRNLLAIWRAHRLDALLCACWRRGVALAGLSAGSMCWFAGGITRSGGRPEPIEGLGLLDGSLSVHLTSEPERAPAFRDAVRRGILPDGWALDDGAALLFEDGRLSRALAARPEARALHDAARGARAAGAARYSPNSVTSSERSPPPSRCSQR